MAGLDANLIAVLHALLRHESVTRAGEELGLTQSATSHALARLRTFFDDPLLVRDGLGMRKTPVAAALEAVVRRAVAAQAELEGRAPGGFKPREEDGAVRLAAPPDVWATWIGGLLGRLSARAPRVRLVAAGTPGEADLAVTDHGAGPPLLEATWVRVGADPTPSVTLAGWPAPGLDATGAHVVSDLAALGALIAGGASAVLPAPLARRWGLQAAVSTDDPPRRLWLHVPETAPPLHRWVAEQLRQVIADRS